MSACYRFGLPKSIGAFELKDLLFAAYKQLYFFYFDVVFGVFGVFVTLVM